MQVRTSISISKIKYSEHQYRQIIQTLSKTSRERAGFLFGENWIQMIAQKETVYTVTLIFLNSQCHCE